MAEKKKIANKAEKKPVAKKIDWAKIPEEVTIEGVKGMHLKKGATYKVTKATAKILVGKGTAKLA